MPVVEDSVRNRLGQLSRRLGDADWDGRAFEITSAGERWGGEYPSRYLPPSVRLRGFEVRSGSGSGGVERFLRDDGLVEFCMFRVRDAARTSENGKTQIYLKWILELVAGSILQIEHLKKNLAWDAVEYGIDIRKWHADDGVSRCPKCLWDRHRSNV
jgi:hypothetical protein